MDYLVGIIKINQCDKKYTKIDVIQKRGNKNV